VSPVSPLADALMFADPKSTPVTCGCTSGATAPAGMKTVAGMTVTLPVSLLVSVTDTPAV
jgi:hypothetical protein